jgi:hypothetical protein
LQPDRVRELGVGHVQLQRDIAVGPDREHRRERCHQREAAGLPGGGAVVGIKHADDRASHRQQARRRVVQDGRADDTVRILRDRIGERRRCQGRDRG